ncbi:MAG: hypothetical protein ACRDYX_06265 [Egibacteraceae bacterium]
MELEPHVLPPAELECGGQLSDDLSLFFGPDAQAWQLVPLPEFRQVVKCRDDDDEQPARRGQPCELTDVSGSEHIEAQPGCA